MWKIKKGKLNIAPLNHLPLLFSKPGGFIGAGRTSLPSAKVYFYNSICKLISKQ